jgi:hypothetical protein
MHGKNQLNSPFRSPHGAPRPMKDDKDDLYDKNPCPVFSEPHSMGPDTIPVVFEEGILGKRYHGKSLEAEAATISTTMGGKK